MKILIKTHSKSKIYYFCEKFENGLKKCPTKIIICDIVNPDGDACRNYSH
ncbi:hypothetical protein [Clostridium haemolyticum]|nr:hypothetical protein [Clostridium haemolyticum]